MPDTGNFDQNPIDQRRQSDWVGAFAALPQETPGPEGWQRLLARLPTAPLPTRRQTRWPLWFATAASLALVIAMPLRMRSVSTSLPAMTTPALDQSRINPVTDPGAQMVPVPGVTSAGENIRSPAPIRATVARIDKPRRHRRADISQQPIGTAAAPEDTKRVASARTTDRHASDTPLESLYSQSAQLEGLLALARDDRVSSGTAAALTGTLDAQVASIDAALAQPDVSAPRRGELWRDRVDSLRQLVGIETTQRLYAARGQQFQAALVSIE